MTDPDPKVLAFQIDGKIRLVWEKPGEEEPEGMWLEFEPLTYGYDVFYPIFTTQTVTIPQDCILYMDINPNEWNYSAFFAWYVNNVQVWAYVGNWHNQTISLSAGDELRLWAKDSRMAGPGQTPYVFAGTMVLRLDDEDGEKVAEFDFETGGQISGPPM